MAPNGKLIVVFVGASMLMRHLSHQPRLPGVILSAGAQLLLFCCPADCCFSNPNSFATPQKTQNQQINHGRCTYTKKNFNLRNYQMDCRHKCSSNCPMQMRYPVVDGNVDMMNGCIHGEHSQKCHLKSGFPVDGCLKDRDDDKKPAATTKNSYTNIKVLMHAKTEEFATNNLALLPEKIWAQVKNGLMKTTIKCGTAYKSIRFWSLCESLARS